MKGKGSHRRTLQIRDVDPVERQNRRKAAVTAVPVKKGEMEDVSCTCISAYVKGKLRSNKLFD